MGPH
jgi:hypothetical protein